jgi:hypothetical protein
MAGQVMQPQTPLLAAELALYGIAVLIKRFKIAKDPCDLVARDSEDVATLCPLSGITNCAVTVGRLKGICLSHR